MKGGVGRGRPGVDWFALYDAWCQTDLDVNEFLKEYGISTVSSTTRAMVSSWKRGEKSAKARMKHVQKIQNHNKINPSGLWQVVQQWRAGQAENDFKTAETIRGHIKLILNNSVFVDANGKQQTRLTPRDLINLADAVETLQKVQRLALGMSTENIGVDRVDESHVEHTEGPDVPIFVVEINENGKFKRARPIQISGSINGK